MIAISILGIFLVNLGLGVISWGYAQPQDPVKELLIREIIVYRDAITRILDAIPIETQLTQEVREYIASIDGIDLNTLSIDELEEIRDRLKDYFEVLREELPIDPVVGDEVRRKILTEVSNVIELILERYNISSIDELYDLVRTYIEQGDIEKAMEVLDELDRVLSEVSVDLHSKEIISGILDMLKGFSLDGNVSSVEALDESIDNIRTTIYILGEVRDYLLSINASEESILALDLAISTLNSTISILENVKSRVGENIVPGELGRAINSTMTDELLEEVAKYKWRVSILLNESNRLENLSIQMNKSYLITLIEEARDALVNASNYLDISENSTLEGNLTNAFNYLNKAKVLIDYAEDILWDVAEILDTELRYEDGEREPSLPKLADKLMDLSEDIHELRIEAEALLNNRLVQSNNMTLNLVQQALSYLDNASILLEEAWEMLNTGNYSQALNLYREAYTLYEAAEFNIDLVEDWLEGEEDREIIDVLLDRIDEYMDEVEELSEMASELYDIAVERNDGEAARLILDAEEKLKNATSLIRQVSELIDAGEYDEASELLDQVAALIMEAKQDLIQAATMLNVSIDDDGEDERDDDATDESGEEDESDDQEDVEDSEEEEDDEEEDHDEDEEEEDDE